MVDSPHSAAGDLPPVGAPPPISADEPTSGRASNARTCAGCGRPAELEDTVKGGGRQRESQGARRPLVRLVIADGELAVDSGSGSFGRGVYVHGEVPCVTAAAQKGLARSAKSAVTVSGQKVTPSLLASLIVDAFERRSKSLLSTAKRAGRLQAGADAAAQAIREGDAALVIVASDAAAARELTEVRKLVAEGKVVVWGDKQELSQNAFGHAREAGVGVVVVTDTRIAGALRESRMIVEALALSDRRSASSNGAASASILGGGAANLRGPGSAAPTSQEEAKHGAEVPSVAADLRSDVSRNQGVRKNA